MANGNGKKSGAQLNREIDEVLRMRQKKQAAATPSRSGLSRSTEQRVLGRLAVDARTSQQEYERRERSEAQQRLAEIRRQPLSDRKEAQGKFLEAMRDDPELVAERLGWLLGGSYGYGAMLMAKQVLKSPRMNRAAALTQMIGAFEWMTPEDMVRAAWKKLSAGEKAALETAVQGAIMKGAIMNAQSEE
jgi:hypothetical protein